MIACSQSTDYCKSCKNIFVINWSKCCFEAKRMKLIFGHFHDFIIKLCTKLTSSGCHVARQIA